MLISFALTVVIFAAAIALLAYSPILFAVGWTLLALLSLFALTMFGIHHNVMPHIEEHLYRRRQNRFRRYLDSIRNTEYHGKVYVYDEVDERWLSGVPDFNEPEFEVHYMNCDNCYDPKFKDYLSKFFNKSNQNKCKEK